MRFLVRQSAVAVLLVLAGGCSQSGMAPVRGKVTLNGKPVTDAQVSFSPVPQSADDREPGKPATGLTGPDGTFVLSTYQTYDGALVGKHHVTISLDETNPAKCKRLQQFEREVAPGDNRMDIELQP